ncbi:MAG: HAMP domain-containing protein [bacterium]|nr:MAG: HAMP domain-containing protein [bacterium]
MARLSLSVRRIRHLALSSLVAIIALGTVFGYSAVVRIETGLRDITRQHWDKFHRVDGLLNRFVAIRGKLTTFVVEEQESPTEILGEIKSLIGESEAAREIFHRPEDLDAMEAFVLKLKEYRASMVAYSQELLLRRTGEGVRSWEKTLLEIETEAHGIIKELKEGIRQEVSEIEEQMLRRGHETRRMMALLGVFGFLLAVVLALIMQRALSQPIRKLIEVSEAMAGGDLTRQVERSSDDEIGALSDALDSMLYNLRRTVAEIQGTVVKVAEVAHGVEHYTGEVSRSSSVQKKVVGDVESSIREMDALVEDVNRQFNRLAEALDDSSSSTLEMRSSIEEVTRFADGMAAEVETITSSLVQMSATVSQNVELLNSLSATSEETAQTMKNLASSSEDVGKHAQESMKLAEQVTELARDRGAAALKAAIDVTSRNREMIGDYSRVIQSLGEKSDSIGEILEVIHDVADQTSLLAINASIIAAQAGEQGKGFAVVAEEVGSLSATTTASIKRVEEVIRTVRKEVADAVEMMGRIVEGAEQSIKSTEHAGEAFREIEESSSVSAGRAREIAEASENQVMRSREILQVVVRNLEEVVKIQEAVEEQKRGQDLIVHSAERIRETALRLKQSTGEQVRESTVITEAVTNTQEFSRKIQDAMEGEQRASKEIVASLGKITESTFDITKALRSLEDLVADLGALAEKLGPEVARFKLPDTS